MTYRPRRLVPPLAVALVAALLATLGVATPASAATFDQKVALLTSWTQASSVTSGTSDWRKNTALFGSSPSAR